MKSGILLKADATEGNRHEPVAILPLSLFSGGDDSS
jgi:hypothetical protein